MLAQSGWRLRMLTHTYMPKKIWVRCLTSTCNFDWTHPHATQDPQWSVYPQTLWPPMSFLCNQTHFPWALVYLRLEIQQSGWVGSWTADWLASRGVSSLSSALRFTAVHARIFDRHWLEVEELEEFWFCQAAKEAGRVFSWKKQFLRNKLEFSDSSVSLKPRRSLNTQPGLHRKEKEKRTFHFKISSEMFVTLSQKWKHHVTTHLRLKVPHKFKKARSTLSRYHLCFNMT